MDDIARAQALADLLAAELPWAVGLGLVGVLLIAGMAFAAVRRFGPLGRGGAPQPAWQLLVWLGLGAGVVLLAGTLFAEMMEAMDAGEELGAFDTRLTEQLALRLSPATLRLVAMATHLGDPLLLVLLVVAVGVALLLRRRAWLALAWLVACGGNGLLNRMLKQIFARVRPVHEHGFAVADGYSFPSGHTSGSVVVYGMLAYLVVRLLPPRWHLPAVLGAAVMAYSMGVSRVLLQVHWASDVAAGFASGLAWLTACVVVVEVARHRQRRVATRLR